MNRENKRKQYQKGYYKTHACDDSFTCRVCGRLVVPAGAGSDHRNHCPNCLSSLHVDDEPGDRAADYGGIMDAIGVWVRKNGEWAVIHRCRRCGVLHSNRAAAVDDFSSLSGYKVLVHGGGRSATRIASQLGIESQMVNEIGRAHV